MKIAFVLSFAYFSKAIKNDISSIISPAQNPFYVPHLKTTDGVSCNST